MARQERGELRAGGSRSQNSVASATVQQSGSRSRSEAISLSSTSQNTHGVRVTLVARDDARNERSGRRHRRAARAPHAAAKTEGVKIGLRPARPCFGEVEQALLSRHPSMLPAYPRGGRPYVDESRTAILAWDAAA